MSPHRRRRPSRVLDQAEGLHRQDREHAGHQVQQEAAGQREGHRLQQRHARRRGGAGRGAEREGLARGAAVEPLGQHEHAVDGRGRRPGELSPRHLDRDAAGVDPRLLGRRVVDGAPASGIEPHLGDALGGEAARGHGEGDRLRRRREGRGPRARRGQGLSRPRDERRPDRMRPRLPRGDGQRERDRRLLGNALLLADQPARPAGQGHPRARDEVGRRRHRDGEHHLIRVAVAHGRPDTDALGMRPGDVARREARGQRPVDLRRLPRIAGIDPVRVPARGDRLAEPDPERLARRDGVALAHELDRDPRTAGPRRASLCGRRREAGREKYHHQEPTHGAHCAHCRLPAPPPRAAPQVGSVPSSRV